MTYVSFIFVKTFENQPQQNDMGRKSIGSVLETLSSQRVSTQNAFI